MTIEPERRRRSIRRGTLYKDDLEQLFRIFECYRSINIETAKGSYNTSSEFFDKIGNLPLYKLAVSMGHKNLDGSYVGDAGSCRASIEDDYAPITGTFSTVQELNCFREAFGFFDERKPFGFWIFTFTNILLPCVWGMLSYKVFSLFLEGFYWPLGVGIMSGVIVLGLNQSIIARKIIHVKLKRRNQSFFERNRDYVVAITAAAFSVGLTLTVTYFLIPLFLRAEKSNSEIHSQSHPNEP